METFGVKLSDVGMKDLSVSALFRGVDLEKGQLELFVGGDSTSFVRAGFHPHPGTDQSVLVYGVVDGVQYDHFSLPAIGMLHGDDIALTFSRTGGLWQLSWDNLMNPASSGASPLIDITTPLINANEDLYVGIYFNTPQYRFPQTETARVEYFSAEVVPEEEAIVVWTILGALAITFGWIRKRKR